MNDGERLMEGLAGGSMKALCWLGIHRWAQAHLAPFSIFAFNIEKCKRCGLGRYFNIGTGHVYVTPLAEESAHERGRGSA